VKINIKDIKGSLMPHIIQFRKDFEEGKVVLEDPKKKEVKK
jgi:hypothetical protein